MTYIYDYQVVTTPIFNCTAPADNNVGNDAGVVAVADGAAIDTEGPAGERRSTIDPYPTNHIDNIDVDISTGDYDSQTPVSTTKGGAGAGAGGVAACTVSLAKQSSSTACVLDKTFGCYDRPCGRKAAAVWSACWVLVLPYEKKDHLPRQARDNNLTETLIKRTPFSAGTFTCDGITDVVCDIQSRHGCGDQSHICPCKKGAKNSTLF